MNRYEAMFIFPESIKEDQLDPAIAVVREEIEKAGGTIDNTTRLGKRTFARPMKKMEGGHYIVIGFRAGGDRIAGLLERYRLSEQIVRVQIHAAEEAPAAAAAPAEGARDGVAQ
ncbi:MAG: 30S ribosomal protein S6 [Lentisphaerae bacterium]|nr:30S ribosomal protein S6 [Lentisphaerota bacterium]